MMKNYSLMVLLLIMVFSATGQTHYCGFDEEVQDLVNRYPDHSNWYSETFPQLLQAYRAQESTIPDDSIFIIPTVVHIFHNGGPENISDAQILDMLYVMNEDYSLSHPDTALIDSTFRGVAAPMQIEFRLAKLDPDSNCTSGIVRHRTRLANELPQGFKTFGWDNQRYLNIYLVGGLYGGAGLIGYAFPPGFNVPKRRDGIMNRSDYAGSIGTATTQVDGEQGSVLSHEAGHYVGLMHTFQDGCSPTLDNDFCDDTPPVAVANQGNCAGINSCNFDVPDLPDNVENIMDYTFGCLRMFTEDQKSIAHFSLSTVFGRKRLVEQENLDRTGVFLDPSPCAPQPDFIIEEEIVFVGDTVVLHGNAYNGVVAAHAWQFPGGNIVTSNTDSTVKVIYDEPGTYSFSLTVGNPEGLNARLFEDRIVVLDTAVRQSGPVIIDFEDPNAEPLPYQILASELGNSFNLTTEAAASGNRSMKLDNWSKFAPAVNREFQKDEIYFGPFDGTSLTNFNLSFDYAFAAKEGFTEDLVRVWISVNGTSWSPRGSISMSDLPTTSTIYQDQPFVPGPGHQWANKSVSVALAQTAPKFWVRIEYVGKYGNNFYMDNLFIGTEVGLEEPGQLAIKAYPNPASDHIILEVGDEPLQGAIIELVDLQGRKVLSQNLPSLDATGSHRVELPLGLTAGCYILRVSSNRGQTVEPWTIH